MIKWNDADILTLTLSSSSSSRLMLLFLIFGSAPCCFKILTSSSAAVPPLTTALCRAVLPPKFFMLTSIFVCVHGWEDFIIYAAFVPFLQHFYCIKWKTIRSAQKWKPKIHVLFRKGFVYMGFLLPLNN